MGDHDERIEEILAEWDLDQGKDADTYSIDLSSYSSVSLTSPYTVSSGINFPNAVYTTASTGSPWVQSPPMAGPKIRLEGADADIEINGVSLWATMQEISNRLNNGLNCVNWVRNIESWSNSSKKNRPPGIV